MVNNSVDNNTATLNDSRGALIEAPEENLIECMRCGQMKTPHKHNNHLCEDCVKAENNRISYYRTNQDWLDVAKDMGIEPWLQQPNETDWEYSVWSAYRDSYPGKRPSYRDVAEQLGTSIAAVRKISSRWSFPVRLQLWVRECDRITMAQRYTEVVDMNKEHIDLARKLRAKIKEGIDKLIPETMRPSEIASLVKVASELERKARLDSISQDTILREIQAANDNPETKAELASAADVKEILKILSEAGALEGSSIGIKQGDTEVAIMPNNTENTKEVEVVTIDG